MKTAETLKLEEDIRIATRKIGIYGCFEVTIGFFGKERVDYMTYEPRTGVFRCYEIKVTKADFHSTAAKSFVGHYNYYVLTKELWDKVKEEIPDGIGVYVGQNLEKRPKKQKIDDKSYSFYRSINGRSKEVIITYTDMLKESMIRSLYRDSDKLLQSGDEQLLNRLRNEIIKTKKKAADLNKAYMTLYSLVVNKYGYKEAEKLLRGEISNGSKLIEED